MKMGDIRCNKCGKNAMESKGYLQRVNPTGEEPAIWECRPSCDGKQLSNAAKLFRAIERG